MKKLFPILFFLLSVNIYSQNTFENTWYLYDSEFRYVLETSDGDYIMLAYMTANNDYIYKISEEGDSLGYINDYLPTDERFSYFGLFHHPEYDDAFVAPAIISSQNGSPKEIALVSFDKYLGIIDVKTVSFESEVINLVPSQIPYSIINEDKIEFAAHVLLRSGEYAHMYASIDISGNLLNYNINKSQCNNFGSYPTCFEIIDKNNQKYGVLYKRVHEDNSLTLTLIVLDSDLKVEDEIEIEYHNYQFDDYGQIIGSQVIEPIDQPKVYYYDDDHILLNILAKKIDMSDSYRGSAFAILDRNYEFIDVNFLFSSTEGKMIKHPLLKAIDINNEYIYECVIENYNSPHPSHPTRCKLRRYDVGLNLIWEKYINDDTDGYYYPRYITSTSDGGCIIVGFTCDKVDFNKSYLYAAKVDSNGNVSINEFNTLSANLLYFYPNPAEDVISLNCSSEVACERVEIYSLDGRLCHSQNFNLKTINIEELSSGVYMMKVVLDNGNSYTEKIVKR